MKGWIIFAAAGLLTGSAAAQSVAPMTYVIPGQSGEGSVYGGGAYWRYASFSAPEADTIGVFGGEGRANFALGPRGSLQLDASGEFTSRISLDETPDPDPRHHGLFGAHISYRGPYGLIGGVAGFSGNNNLDHNGEMSHGIVGLEAQLHASMITFYYQGGYFWRLSGSNNNEPLHLWFNRGVARVLLNPTTMLSGEIAHATGPTQGNGYTAVITAWRVEFEHMMKPNGPFAVFARYDGQHSYSTYDPVEGAIDEHSVVIGFKAMFGQPDLATRNRKGATLDMPSSIVRTLPYAWPWYG